MASGASASGLARAVTRKRWASSESGNEPASQPGHTTPPALGEDAHSFLVDALARPLAEIPDAPERALQQADRALAETMEYHAHVRLRRVA